MTPVFVQNQIQVGAGSARVAHLLNAVPEQHFVVLYSPKVAGNLPRSEFAPMNVGGNPVLLTTETTPLLLSLPGTYLFEPDGEVIGVPDIEVPAAFPVTMVVQAPQYVPPANTEVAK